MSARGLWDRLRHALGHYPATADEWAVRVQCADVTRHELLALDEWLKADPRNAEDYARVNKIAHLGLKLRDHPGARARLLDYPVPAAGNADARLRTPLQSPRLMAGVAATCIAAVAAWVALPQLPPFTSRYASERGEQRQVTLTDGSRMIVNTDSEVRVDFDAASRSLDLVRGEAFFEVTRDPSRPFVVRAGKAEVRVVGTKFSVRREGDDSEVVVIEGKVEIVRQTRASTVPPMELVPGHRARISGLEAPVQVAMVDAPRAIAWTAGNVEFDEATLVEVIRDVNRYTSKEFVIADPAIAEVRFSGRFRVGDTESVKSALQHRFNINAVDDGRVIRLGLGR